VSLKEEFLFTVMSEKYKVRDQDRPYFIPNLARMFYWSRAKVTFVRL
jgi:hypothetical protein